MEKKKKVIAELKEIVAIINKETDKTDKTMTYDQWELIEDMFTIGDNVEYYIKKFEKEEINMEFIYADVKVHKKISTKDVETTDSSVTLEHIPTKIKVTYNENKSQGANYECAMNKLEEIIKNK